MSTTLIQPEQMEKIAQLVAARSSRGCPCGHYIFYSAICGHLYWTYHLKCGNRFTKTGRFGFCNRPAGRHIMRNHTVAAACDDCRGIAMLPPRPSANSAAAPSTGYVAPPQISSPTQPWSNTALGSSAPVAADPSTSHFISPEAGPSTQPWSDSSFPFAGALSTIPLPAHQALALPHRRSLASTIILVVLALLAYLVRLFADW